MEGLQEAKTVPRFNGRHAQPESHNHPLDGEALNIWKIMSHDLRGSLIVIMATLKLLSRAC